MRPVLYQHVSWDPEAGGDRLEQESNSMSDQLIISRFTGEYSYLSNFHPCPIPFEGITYPSAEHAYQAAKTLDQVTRYTIQVCSTPGQAKARGQRIPLRPSWEDLKILKMGHILTAKFSIPELRDKLISTDTSMLVEGNNWGDTFWGICDGEGYNILGKILMGIRDDIQIRPYLYYAGRVPE